ncbi:MAG: lipopolysaccharide kinase InaA family protein [Halanaerobiales bacterium]|nr:lipopolysaccharide kinase InaA family protein [Halanaerobiales bacterium]
MLKNNSFISFQKNNVDIKLKSSLPENWLDSFLAQYCNNQEGEEIEKGETIYNIRNQIIKVTDPILHKKIVIKNFKLERTYDQLRFRLLPSKAERSLKIARALKRAGLNTPSPLAVIEKRGKTNELIFSYYVTDYVDYDFNMLEIAKDFEHPERYKIKGLMPQLGKEVKRMHKANIVHNDLHAGNILIKDFETKPKLYYIDLNRGRIKDELSEKDKIDDLKRLKFTDQEKKIFFKNYAPGNWKYYYKKVSEARQKRRKFVKTKNKIREFFGIK